MEQVRAEAMRDYDNVNTTAKKEAKTHTHTTHHTHAYDNLFTLRQVVSACSTGSADDWV